MICAWCDNFGCPRCAPTSAPAPSAKGGPTLDDVIALQQRLAEDLARVERERDALQNRLITLQAELVQAECAAAEAQREGAEARAALGEGWLTGDVTLAQGITRKTKLLEQLAGELAQERDAARRRSLSVISACTQAVYGATRGTHDEAEIARAVARAGHNTLVPS